MRDALNAFVIRGVSKHPIPGGAARPSAFRVGRVQHRLHRRGVSERVRSGCHRAWPIATSCSRSPPPASGGCWPDRPSLTGQLPGHQLRLGAQFVVVESAPDGTAPRDAGRDRGRWRRLPGDDRRADTLHRVHERARRHRRRRPRRRCAVSRQDRASRADAARLARRRARRGARSHAARRRAARAHAVQAAARPLALPALADAGPARLRRRRSRARRCVPASGWPSSRR